VLTGRKVICRFLFPGPVGTDRDAPHISGQIVQCEPIGIRTQIRGDTTTPDSVGSRRREGKGICRSAAGTAGGAPQSTGALGSLDIPATRGETIGENLQRFGQNPGLGLNPDLIVRGERSGRRRRVHRY
jgi:hypothetical protein